MGRIRLKRWHYRPTAFKAGFCGVMLAAVLCVLGLLAPAWQNTGGLWMYQSLLHPVPAWFQSVRVLVVLCTALILLSITVETVQDSCLRGQSATDNAAVEILAACAGVLGSAGLITFAVAVHQYPDGQGPYGSCRVTLFWAWYLETLGSLLALISAVIIGRSRATHRQTTARNMQVVAFRKTAPVSVNPYFVSRSVPSVKILPANLVPDQPRDSHA